MLYQDRYRIPSIRLKYWDYASAGYYFITICTNQRWTNPFGYIRNGYICLSSIGTIANQCWLTIPQHFHNVKLDVFVIMPDHMHGIIQIINQEPSARRDVACNVSTKNVHTNKFYSCISPRNKSLPTVVRSYKSAVTRLSRNNNYNFQWQSRYYERIIRSSSELLQIRRYITNNPKLWSKSSADGGG